jgi:hypothetical protein
MSAEESRAFIFGQRGAVPRDSTIRAVEGEFEVEVVFEEESNEGSYTGDDDEDDGDQGEF